MKSPPSGRSAPPTASDAHCGGDGDDAGVSALVRSLEALLAGSGATIAAASTRPAPGHPRDSDEGIAVGHADLVVERLRDAFPDATWTIDAVSAERDLVLCHATVAGTHTRRYAGQAPSARRVTMRAVFIARIAPSDDAHAQAADWWCALDDSLVRAPGAQAIPP